MQGKKAGIWAIQKQFDSKSTVEIIQKVITINYQSFFRDITKKLLMPLMPKYLKSGLINNGFQPLTIITKSSTLDVAAVLDPSLLTLLELHICNREEKLMHVALFK